MPSSFSRFYSSGTKQGKKYAYDDIGKANELRKLECDLYSALLRSGKTTKLMELVPKCVDEFKEARSLKARVGILRKLDHGRSALSKLVKKSNPLMVKAFKIRNEFVMANMGLVGMFAGRYLRMSNSMEHSDLTGAGVAGLIKAVDRYDPDRGFAFGTCAAWWIRHAISRDIINTDHTIRLPVHMHSKGHKPKRVRSLDAPIDEYGDDSVTLLSVMQDHDAEDPHAEVEAVEWRSFRRRALYIAIRLLLTLPFR